MAESGGERRDDLQVGAYPRRRRPQPFPPQYPTLQIGHRPLLLRPLGGRQDDVGHGRRLAEHEVGDDEQVQGGQPRGDPTGPGGGDGDVAAEDEERPRPLRRAERVQHLVGAAARTGDGRRVDAPDPTDVLPGHRIGDLALAGKLVGLLPVFPAALPVALAGETAVARPGGAGQPQ